LRGNTAGALKTCSGLTHEHVKHSATPKGCGPHEVATAVAAFQTLAGEVLVTKQMDDVLEFLRAFISGGSQQDFKLWAGELYQQLYRAAPEPRAAIPTWRERCETHPEHQGAGMVTSRMIECRMQEEIDDLRAALNRPAEPKGDPFAFVCGTHGPWAPPLEHCPVCEALEQQSRQAGPTANAPSEAERHFRDVLRRIVASHGASDHACYRRDLADRALAAFPENRTSAHD